MWLQWWVCLPFTHSQDYFWWENVFPSSLPLESEGIVSSVKWIFCTVNILSSMQSLIYIILCRCAQAKWFLNELQPRVGPFSSINFDELLSFINCTCFSVPISSTTFVFHICVSILESAISRVSKFFFHRRFLPVFYDWVVGSHGLAHACFQSLATVRNETLIDIIVQK